MQNCIRINHGTLKNKETETTVYSDRPSIHYPPISDAFVTKEYFSALYQEMIQLWPYLRNGLFNINKQKSSLLQKAPKLGELDNEESFIT